MNGNDRSDKLLLVLILVLFCLLIVHFSHDPHDERALTWAMQTGNLVTGALLALMTRDRSRRNGEQKDSAEKDKVIGNLP